MTETNRLYTWGSSPQNLRIQAQSRKRSKLQQNQNSTAPNTDSTKSGASENVQNVDNNESLEEPGSCNKNLSETHLSPSLVDTSNVDGEIVQVKITFFFFFK